jgi:hypothetical protein
MLRCLVHFGTSEHNWNYEILNSLTDFCLENVNLIGEIIKLLILRLISVGQK